MADRAAIRRSLVDGQLLPQGEVLAFKPADLSVEQATTFELVINP